MKLISTTFNSNINHFSAENKLPICSQGLLPPFTKRMRTEQYYGREIKNLYYWDASDPSIQGYNIYMQPSHQPLDIKGSPSKSYELFVELWNSTRLVAVLCGEEYLSPDEHISSQKDPARRYPFMTEGSSKNILARSDFRSITNESEIIYLLEEWLQYPCAFSKEYLEAKYPSIKKRNVRILRFNA